MFNRQCGEKLNMNDGQSCHKEIGAIMSVSFLFTLNSGWKEEQNHAAIAVSYSNTFTNLYK